MALSKERKAEIKDMQTRFPLEYIPNMTIEEYVTVGNPFCFINMMQKDFYNGVTISGTLNIQKRLLIHSR